MKKINLGDFSRERFLKLFGEVFEHSPQFVLAVFDSGIVGEISADELCSLFCSSFDAASHNEKLQVLLAHPSLAGKLALAKKLTTDSTIEQHNAGLDNLSPEMQDEFSSLNSAYEKKFSFPFIICVANLTAHKILSEFQQRILNSQHDEFSTACLEVKKIALVRTLKIFQEFI